MNISNNKKKYRHVFFGPPGTIQDAETQQKLSDNKRNKQLFIKILLVEML